MKFDLTKYGPKNLEEVKYWHRHFQLTPLLVEDGGKKYFVWLEYVDRYWSYISNPAYGAWAYRMPRNLT